MTDHPSGSLRRFVSPDPDLRLRVAISLKARRPTGECLERLKSHGLTVDQTIGNKILGSISQSNRSLLASDAEVDEIEIGTPLSSL